jgi:hypothetical protein
MREMKIVIIIFSVCCLMCDGFSKQNEASMMQLTVHFLFLGYIDVRRATVSTERTLHESTSV